MISGGHWKSFILDITKITRDPEEIIEEGRKISLIDDETFDQ